MQGQNKTQSVTGQLGQQPDTKRWGEEEEKKKKIKKGQRTERQREVEGVLTGGKEGFLEIEKKEEQSGGNFRKIRNLGG